MLDERFETVGGWVPCLTCGGAPKYMNVRSVLPAVPQVPAEDDDVDVQWWEDMSGGAESSEDEAAMVVQKKEKAPKGPVKMAAFRKAVVRYVKGVRGL